MHLVPHLLPAVYGWRRNGVGVAAGMWWCQAIGNIRAAVEDTGFPDTGKVHAVVITGEVVIGDRELLAD